MSGQQSAPAQQQQPTPAQLQQLTQQMQQDPSKKPKKASSAETSFEKPHTPGQHIERAVINFTRIPQKLLEFALTGEVQPDPSTYQNLNDPDIKKRLEESHDPEYKKQKALAEARKAFQRVNSEVQTAQAQIRREKDEKIENEKQLEQHKEQQKIAAQKRNQQLEEPSSRPARGMLFGAKTKKKSSAPPPPTAENSAAMGHN